jgi:hypothetical protein
MPGFIDGEEWSQSVRIAQRFADRISEGNPVRVLEAFVEEAKPGALGFACSRRANPHPVAVRDTRAKGQSNSVDLDRDRR